MSDAANPILPGGTYARDALGVSIDWLEQCVLAGRIFPPAPDFKGPGGAIDSVTRIGFTAYTVTACSVRPDVIRYRLTPLEPANVRPPLFSWKTVMERRKGPPEEAELNGMGVTDAGGREWCFRALAESVLCEVPRSAMGARLLGLVRGMRTHDDPPPPAAIPAIGNRQSQIDNPQGVHREGVVGANRVFAQPPKEKTVSSKSKSKSGGTAAATKPPAKMDVDVLTNLIDKALWGADQKVDDAEAKVKAAQAALAAAKRNREFLKVRIGEALAASQIPAALEIKPYDADLHKLLTADIDWSPLAGGATDTQIREKLEQAWNSYAYPERNRSTGRGGNKLAVFINPTSSYSAKPTLEGAKLVSEARRLLRIPQAAGVESDRAGKAATAPKNAKPAGKGQGAKDKGPAFRPQTFGQWKATLRGSLGKDHAALADDPKNEAQLKAWFDAKNIKPGEAAKMLKDAAFEAGPNRVTAAADLPGDADFDPEDFDGSNDLPGRDAGEQRPSTPRFGDAEAQFPFEKSKNGNEHGGSNERQAKGNGKARARERQAQPVHGEVAAR